MGLTAATYLGDNTVGMLDGLVGHLRRRTGLDVRVDEQAGRSSTDARLRANGLALAWICGHLGQRLIDERIMRGTVVAAPVFSGESAPVYRSVIITRRGWADDLDAAVEGTVAVNEPESWSGHLALRHHVEERADRGWFRAELHTGSHLASIEAVAAGGCDVAGIDSSIWAHLDRTRPGVGADLQVIDVTEDWPAPPLVIGHQTTTTERQAILQSILDFDPTGIEGLDRFVAAGPDHAVRMRRRSHGTA